MATIFDFSALQDSLQVTTLFGEAWFVIVILTTLLFFTLSRNMNNLSILFLPIYLSLTQAGIWVPPLMHAGILTLGTLAMILGSLGIHELGSIISAEPLRELGRSIRSRVTGRTRELKGIRAHEKAMRRFQKHKDLRDISMEPERDTILRAKHKKQLWYAQEPHINTEIKYYDYMLRNKERAVKYEDEHIAQLARKHQLAKYKVTSDLRKAFDKNLSELGLRPRKRKKEVQL